MIKRLFSKVCGKPILKPIYTTNGEEIPIGIRKAMAELQKGSEDSPVVASGGHIYYESNDESDKGRYWLIRRVTKLLRFGRVEYRLLNVDTGKFTDVTEMKLSTHYRRKNCNEL